MTSERSCETVGTVTRVMLSKVPGTAFAQSRCTCQRGGCAPVVLSSLWTGGREPANRYSRLIMRRSYSIELSYSAPDSACRSNPYNLVVGLEVVHESASRSFWRFFCRGIPQLGESIRSGSVVFHDWRSACSHHVSSRCPLPCTEQVCSTIAHPSIIPTLSLHTPQREPSPKIESTYEFSL